MSANVFGRILAPLGLPAITVFIGFGVACGPFGLDLISARDSILLSWINSFALGFIGFSAGGHFHVSDMRSVIPVASIVLGTLVVITYGGVLAAVLTLGGIFIPFFAPLDGSQRMAAALLFACLAVARSPSSAIALISELNARGPFTSTVLAVTVMMDVVVVVLFSVTLTVARTLDPRGGGDGDGHGHGGEGGSHHLRALGGAASEAESSSVVFSVLEAFMSEVVLSGLAGVALGLIVPFVVSIPLSLTQAEAPEAQQTPRSTPRATTSRARPAGGDKRSFSSSSRVATSAKAALAALALSALALAWRAFALGVQRLSLPTTGWLLFYEEELAHSVPAFHGGAWLNPLIATMVAGFVVVNFTQGGPIFHEAADGASGPIFLLFFVYTGVAMDVGVLARNLPVCALVFTARAGLVYVSTTIGGMLAGSPPDHTSAYWGTFLTQAGVTLGLAQSAAAHFAWGADFVASIVAVSVLNQVVGPILFKRALRGVGETHHNYAPIGHGAHAGHSPLDDDAAAAARIGQPNVPLIPKPQPRGALVIAPVEDEGAALVAKRLASRGWEVLEVDASLATRPGAAIDTTRLERTASESLERSSTLHSRKRGLGLSVYEMLQAPEVPSLPASVEANPDRYGKELRLLWLGASMTSFDVIICLLPTDDDNLEIVDLLSDITPMLRYARDHDPSPPQLVLSLHEPTDDLGVILSVIEPPPVVLPRERSLSSLICEVLHPAAHWSGVLDAPALAMDDDDGGDGDEKGGDEEKAGSSGVDAAAVVAPGIGRAPVAEPAERMVRITRHTRPPEPGKGAELM